MTLPQPLDLDETQQFIREAQNDSDFGLLESVTLPLLAEVSRLRAELAKARLIIAAVEEAAAADPDAALTALTITLAEQVAALRAQVAEHEQRADQMREYARVLIRGTGEIPAVDVAWKLQQIVGPVALPLASDQEREHPGTGTRMEPVECAPDGTWHTLSILREESARDD